MNKFDSFGYDSTIILVSCLVLLTMLIVLVSCMSKSYKLPKTCVNENDNDEDSSVKSTAIQNNNEKETQTSFIKRQDIIIYNDLYFLNKEKDENPPGNSNYSNMNDNEVDTTYANFNDENDDEQVEKVMPEKKQDPFNKYRTNDEPQNYYSF